MKKTLTHKRLLYRIVQTSLLQIFIAILFSGITLATPVKGQEMLERKVSIHVSDLPLGQVLKSLEKSAQVKFSFNSRTLNLNQNVSVNATNETLSNILTKILKPLNISHIQVSNRIVLRKEESAKVGLLEEPLLPTIILPVDQIISGTVTDETGMGLPGVSVLVKETGSTTRQRGTTTDPNGKYKIDIPDGDVSLVFSFVGYLPQEVQVGNQTQINVSLKVDTKTLDEVVVTAFGIKRDQKALGYASQKVGGEQLSAVGNTNIQNSLQGKAAGVQVRLSSGMPGRPAQVNIRGSRSLTGNNEPLYVIDGLPVSGGGRSIDFNPSDVESMDILKGPAAAALYGVRASNGVIVITTKSGKNSQQKPTITFESQIAQDKVSYLPKLQYEYAQGNNGIFDQNGLFAYGAKISTIGSYTNLRGEQEQAASYNNMQDFFKTGITLNNNLEISQGGTFGNYSIGVGNTNQQGIVKNTSLNRTNFKFNGLMTPYKKLKVGLSFNYSNNKVRDLSDEIGNAAFFFGVFSTPPSYNLKGKPYNEPTNIYQQVFFRAGQNNPYWAVENNYRIAKTDRTFGNLFTEYQITKDLKAVYRIGIDNFSTNTIRYDELGTGPVGRTNPPSGGLIQISNNRQTQINSNFFLNFDKNINSNFSFNAILGNEIFDNRGRNDFASGANFVAGGWANLSNATNINVSNFLSSQRVVGFYGNVNIGFKEMLFLNASGRNDVVSNMLASNRSFFYPSVGLSFVLSEAIPSLNEKITFAKIRANYAEVGQVGPLFVNDLGYVRSNPGFLFPYNGVTSFLPNGSSINADLRPENTKSIELGGELRFWNNRIGIDYTYFNSLSNGQILGVPLPPSTGASNEVRNAGKMRSYGHEIMFKFTPIKNRNSQWDFNVNFTKFRTKVESLSTGLTRIILSDANGGQVQIVAQEGQTYPSIFGRTYVRDPQSGQIVVNSTPGQATTGMPLLSGSPSILGTPNPDFEFNFINSFRYKNLSLGLQLDWRQGGQFFSLTRTEAYFRGLAEETLNREEQVVLDAVKGRIVNGQLTVEGKNDLPIYRANTYWSGSSMFNNVEAQLQDASFLRLREVNLSYELNPAKLKKALGLSGVSFFITGRNLFLITKAFVDPELNMSNLGGASVGNSAGIEWFQTPQTKSIGAGVKLKW